MTQGPRRNDPCPCHSGQKYKACCGRPQVAPRDELFMRRRGRLIGEILDMFWDLDLKDEHDEATEEFIGEDLAALSDEEFGVFFEPNTMESIAFMEWIVHDYLLSDGRPVIDRFLERRGRRLGAEERAYLEAARETVVSLHLVEAVRPREGLTLRDVFLGGIVDVEDRAASGTLRTGDVVAARLQEMGGVMQFCGALIHFPPASAPGAMQALRDDYGAWLEAGFGRKGDGKDDPDHRRLFLKENGAWFYQEWRATTSTPPRLQTTDGEELRPSSAHYDVDDADHVSAMLDGVPAFDREDNAPGEWVWLGEATKDAGGQTLLGDLELAGHRLILRCLSVGRLQKGRVLVEEACGDAVRHRLDVEEDLRSVLEDGGTARRDPARRGPGQRGGSRRGGAAASVPESEDPQVIAAVVGHLTEYYRRWLDEPVPALDGLTPRQAAADPAYHDMLRVLVGGVGQSLGEGTYDPRWILDELGLGARP